MEWWPGEYDNHEQIVRQSGGGFAVPVYEPVFRIHSHYVRLDLPELGENVLYVEEYRNNDPSNISRIRVYALPSMRRNRRSGSNSTLSGTAMTA